MINVEVVAVEELDNTYTITAHEGLAGSSTLEGLVKDICCSDGFITWRNMILDLSGIQGLELSSLVEILMLRNACRHSGGKRRLLICCAAESPVIRSLSIADPDIRFNSSVDECISLLLVEAQLSRVCE